MINKTSAQKGFVLLYIMLALAAIVTSVALVGGTMGIFSGNRTKQYEGIAKARMISQECAERVMMMVRNSPSSTGSGNIVIDDGSCDYVISGSVPAKTITIAVSRNNYYKRITITTSQTSPTIQSNWTENQ